MGQAVGNDNGSPPVFWGSVMEMPSDEVIPAFCLTLCGEAKAPVTGSTYDIQHVHTEHPHTYMFPLQWMWETWQESLFHCGQTWPPITLPCGSIVWQRRGQEAGETFCPACRAAKINKSSNLSNLWSLLICVTTTDLLWQRHRAGLMSSRSRKIIAHLYLQRTRMRGATWEICLTVTKSLPAVHSQNKPAEELFTLARPCREILTKILPRAKFNLNSSSLVSSKYY